MIDITVNVFKIEISLMLNWLISKENNKISIMRIIQKITLD